VDASAFLTLALGCAPDVHPATARAIAHVESNFNRFAIGVVGGRLARQPRTQAEAIATVKALRAAGWNYSVGLTQINVSNFARLGLDARSALDPCTSLTAMQSVLAECHARATRRSAAQTALREALSCYYSGNFTTGLRDGYVRKVVLASVAAAPVFNRKEPS
jgi:type IV secretion system protein VirB1